MLVNKRSIQWKWLFDYQKTSFLFMFYENSISTVRIVLPSWSSCRETGNHLDSHRHRGSAIINCIHTNGNMAGHYHWDWFLNNGDCIWCSGCCWFSMLLLCPTATTTTSHSQTPPVTACGSSPVWPILVILEFSIYPLRRFYRKKN